MKIPSWDYQIIHHQTVILATKEREVPVIIKPIPCFFPHRSPINWIVTSRLLERIPYATYDPGVN